MAIVTVARKMVCMPTQQQTHQQLVSWLSPHLGFPRDPRNLGKHLFYKGLLSTKLMSSMVHWNRHVAVVIVLHSASQQWDSGNGMATTAISATVQLASRWKTLPTNWNDHGNDGSCKPWIIHIMSLLVILSTYAMGDGQTATSVPHHHTLPS